MKSHEFAELLLTMPDSEITASVDLDDGGKVFAKSICDVFKNKSEVVIHFELSEAQS